MAGIDGLRILKIADTLSATSREHANLEAEKGETVVTDIGGNGMPQLYKIAGKPHSRGGTPLNLPDDSFIFSKDKKMRINDKFLLQEFGMSPNKKATPAEISKKFDLNKYHQILLDPMSSEMERRTAERMIEKNTDKLSQLALVQESIKGFKDGLPSISQNYLDRMEIEEAELLPIDEEEMETPLMRLGGVVKNLTKYKEGGSPKDKKKKKTTYYDMGGYRIPSSIPKDSTKWDISLEGYQEALDNGDVKEGDYLYNPETKRWSKIKMRDLQAGEFKDDRLGNLQGAYSNLLTALNTEGLENDLTSEFRNIIRKSNLSTPEKNVLLALDPDQVMDIFKEGQKQVYSIDANNVLRGEDGQLKSDLSKWDRGKPNVEYNKVMKELGFDSFDDMQIQAFQGAYHAFQDIMKDEKYKGIRDKFNLSPIGLDDQTRGGKAVSPIDSIFGNTTAGQAVLPKNLQEQYEEEVEIFDEDEPTSPTSEATIHDVEPELNVENSPWWLQDVINLAGSVKDYTDIRKHNPWQAEANIQGMNPMYLDPTRQISATQEMAQQGIDALETYGGPNAFNSRFSGLQGNAAQQIANIEGTIANQNVQIHNQFEQTNKQLMNQASAQKAALATQLYDKQTVANQQFHNEKKQAEQMIRQGIVNGITNANETAAMNAMHPQFAVDPSTGGRLVFSNPRELTGDAPSQQDIYAQLSNAKKQNPHLSMQEIIDIYKIESGYDVDNRKETRLAQKEQQADPKYMGYPNQGHGRGKRAQFGGENKLKRLVRIKF